MSTGGLGLVLCCFQSLLTLSAANNVKLSSKPPGFEENGKAHFLPKKGANETFLGPDPVFGIISSLARH